MKRTIAVIALLFINFSYSQIEYGGYKSNMIIDYSELTNQISNTLLQNQQSREEKKALLENITQQCKTTIMSISSVGYSSQLNNFEFGVQNRMIEEVNYFHNQLINGILDPNYYPIILQTVVSNYNMLIKVIDNFNLSLNTKIQTLKNENDLESISSIETKINDLTSSCFILYTYSSNPGRRYTDISDQKLSYNYKGTVWDITKFYTALFETLNITK